MVVRTATQSSRGNSLCERHNAVLGDMVTKTLADVKYNFEVALEWALHNVNRYSPNQLVLNRNPNIPTNRPPAL